MAWTHCRRGQRSMPVLSACAQPCLGPMSGPHAWARPRVCTVDPMFAPRHHSRYGPFRMIIWGRAMLCAHGTEICMENVARMGRIFHRKFRCIVTRWQGDNNTKDCGCHIFRRPRNFFFPNCGFKTNCGFATKSRGFGTTDGGFGMTDRECEMIGHGFTTTDKRHD